MAGSRLSARRRRKARRLRNLLLSACAEIEEGPQPAKTHESTESSSKDDTKTPTTNRAGQSDKSPVTGDARETPSNPNPKIPPRKRRCRHRRLPVSMLYPYIFAIADPKAQDRHYYNRVEVLDYRYLNFQRRINGLVRGWVAYGKKEVARSKWDNDTRQFKFEKRMKEEASYIQRDYKGMKQRVKALEDIVTAQGKGKE